MKIIRKLKEITLGLVRIDDTPQRIALGLGLGVFCGIFPGTGPIAAIFLAILLRVNRAASLIGSLATNTWLSFATFLVAIKTGAWLWGLKWTEVYNSWAGLIREFSWPDLFKLSVLKLVLPVLSGFLSVAFCLGVGVYLITYLVLKCLRIHSDVKI